MEESAEKYIRKSMELRAAVNKLLNSRKFVRAALKELSFRAGMKKERKCI